MTRDRKIQLLTLLFLKVSHHGVLTWGETKNGYRWTCEDHEIARELALSLLDLVDILRMDTGKFPYHFEPDDGATVVFEPVGD
ncbi:MAG: hypothetical protein IAG10_30185 [Planctomycetaceae bacterium]|nr:hypothetical protein [Planctomycetaceae bacterium]